MNSTDDVRAGISDVLAWETSGRETAEERVHFNAVGLAYVDVGIAHAMYQRACEAGAGQQIAIQENMIFQHETLRDWIRLP